MQENEQNHTNLVQAVCFLRRISNPGPAEDEPGDTVCEPK
jgi:hypothetical protein